MKKMPRIVVNIESSSGYGRGLLTGISDYAKLHGPWLFIRRPELYHGRSSPREFVEHIESLDIDGVFMRDFELEDLHHLESTAVPTILVSHYNRDTELPCLLADNRAVGHLAAEHFLERGFRSFAFCGMEPFYWSDERQAGFSEALADKGYRGAARYQSPRANSQRSFERELQDMAKWLKGLETPVGIFAATDERAALLIEACEFIGLRVPEEAAIIGCDNDEFVCELSAVPISSVRIDARKAGFEAAALMDRMFHKQPFERDRILVDAVDVQVRQSSDVLAIPDPKVAKALNFINTKASMNMTVDDVASAAGISRRHLYDKFKKHLGRTVFEQINIARIARICDLLEKTDLSMLEIALKMGMGDDKHLYRYFRRYKGVTPYNWRRSRRL